MSGRSRTVGAEMLLQKIPVPPPLTDELRDAARRVVCANADDAAEAETLLAMLGLL